MPTYDFRCTGCNCVFEFNRPFGSREVPPCPECGSKDVEKLIAPPTIQFKGEGFYKTDSQKPTPKAKKEEKKQETAKEGDAKTAEKTPKEQKDSKKGEK